MVLTKAILHKRFVDILEMFIDACYESSENEKEILYQEACEDFDAFTDEFNLEEDWKTIIEFTNEYIDTKQQESDIDILQIKHLVASMLEW